MERISTEEVEAVDKHDARDRAFPVQRHREAIIVTGGVKYVCVRRSASGLWLDPLVTVRATRRLVAQQ
jgi:hypothetical protein